jgi:hypothetical protein
MEIPIGTIIIDFERQVYRYNRGKCKVVIGIAYLDPETGKGDIAWCNHRTLRLKPVYEVELPDGSKVEVARLQHE